MRRRHALAIGAGGVLVAALLSGIVTTSSSADAAPKRPRPVAVFIGDSFTKGAGATKRANSFAARVGAHEHWRVVNLGRGGTGYVTASTQGLLSCGIAYCGAYGERVDDAMAARPAVVIVSGGINDVNQPLPVFRSGVDQLFADLKAHLPKRTFIAVTTPQWPEAVPPEAFDLEVQAVRASAKQHRVHYLDIGEPLATGMDLKAADGVHPNDVGHAVIARAIEKGLARHHHP
jgi:lysophospholipase L1-like esterase